MSWVDKAHQKNKLQKQIDEILNGPEYKKEREEFRVECVANALARFTFFACGFLETRYGYKKEGLKKFLEFIKLNLSCTEDDENFFITYSQYYKDEYDLDVLGELGLKIGDKNDIR